MERVPDSYILDDNFASTVSKCVTLCAPCVTSFAYRRRLGGPSDIRQLEAFHPVCPVADLCVCLPSDGSATLLSQIYPFAYYSGGYTSTPMYVYRLLASTKSDCRCKDVVVPLPLPLSAILILVIGSSIYCNSNEVLY